MENLRARAPGYLPIERLPPTAGSSISMGIATAASLAQIRVDRRVLDRVLDDRVTVADQLGDIAAQCKVGAPVLRQRRRDSCDRSTAFRTC